MQCWVRRSVQHCSALGFRSTLAARWGNEVQAGGWHPQALGVSPQRVAGSGMLQGPTHRAIALAPIRTSCSGAGGVGVDVAAALTPPTPPGVACGSNTSSNAGAELLLLRLLEFKQP